MVRIYSLCVMNIAVTRIVVIGVQTFLRNHLIFTVPVVPAQKDSKTMVFYYLRIVGIKLLIIAVYGIRWIPFPSGRWRKCCHVLTPYLMQLQFVICHELAF